MSAPVLAFRNAKPIPVSSRANQRLERAQRQLKELHDEAPDLFAMVEDLVVELLAEIRS
jgi:hypothetical protein